MGAKKVDNNENCGGDEDAERELSRYNKSIWKNKVVFCECDDPPDDGQRLMSAFPLYFLLNINKLGLKKLNVNGKKCYSRVLVQKI